MDWISPLAKVPVNLTDPEVGQVAQKVARFSFVEDIEYIRKASTDWQEFALSSGRAVQHFDWIAVRNFNPDALIFTLDLDGRAHALMMLRDRHVVRCDHAHRGGLVYVSFLEVAPWNGRGAPRRQLSGVGATMLRMACDLSQQRGHGGRIGLHSVATAEDFYRRLGFQSLDCPNEYKELYFELDSSAAQTLLSN